MRIPLWLKIAWTAFVAVWIPVAWDFYGAQVFLHFCALGNLMILVALWTESPLVISWQAVSLLVFQSLYALDVVATVASGRHAIGGTEYLFRASAPLPIRLFSLYHFVAPIVVVWTLLRLGYDKRGWLLGVVALVVVLPINYVWRPGHDVNWARGPFFHEQHVVPGWLYLAAYGVIVPLVVYLPTHLVLRRLVRPRELTFG